MLELLMRILPQSLRSFAMTVYVEVCEEFQNLIPRPLLLKVEGEFYSFKKISECVQFRAFAVPSPLGEG